MAELAVALLDGAGLAEPLARRTGLTVEATTPADHLDVARRLGEEADLVVGMAAVPWPTQPDLHAEGSAVLPAYTGVVSWHALPRLAEVLADAVAPGARLGAHVLITAPDTGEDVEPQDLTFLREVAAALEARVPLPSRSIAWRGSGRAPTAVAALHSLAEAHGKRDVVECPVAPGTPADPDLLATADRLGMRLTCVDLGRGTLLELLALVVATVAGHEIDDDGPTEGVAGGQWS